MADPDQGVPAVGDTAPDKSADTAAPQPEAAVGASEDQPKEAQDAVDEKAQGAPLEQSTSSAAEPAAASVVIDPEAYQGEPKLTITPGKMRATKWNAENPDIPKEYPHYMPVLVEVEAPAGKAPMHIDICVVIDISGSMSAEATIQNVEGVQERHGLTLLDIAKHGVRTIIASLSDNDRLSIVWFNHMAGQSLPLTNMDAAGQEEAIKKLEEIEAGGGTNIWQGLEQGMNSLNGNEARGGRLAHVMLLTDGQTTNRNTVMPNLKEYKEKHEQLPGTLSTFGFGYNIDSPLLVEISNFGDATYSFIPDAGFVGTVFVNTLSNLLVTFAKEVTIAIDMTDATDCKIEGVHGSYEWIPDESNDGIRVKLGTLQYQQKRSVVLFVACATEQVADESEMLAGLSFQYSTKATVEAKAATAKLHVQAEGGAENEKMVGPQRLRSRFIETVNHVVSILSTVSEDTLQKAQGIIDGFLKEIEDSGVTEDAFAQLVKLDASGQSKEAVSRADWYRKWGCHYLPSIVFAHKTQQCNNFKDPGVQSYGGVLFQSILDEADKKFNSLPPPKPSARSARQAAAVSRPANMSSYNDRYGG